jgi:hypothetical protein
MDDKFKIAIVIIILFVIGFPLIGQVMKSDQAAQSTDAAKATEKAPARKGGPVLPPMPKANGPMQPMQQPGQQPMQPMLPPRPQGPQGPPPLDPRSLEGSVWSAEGATIYLFAGGKATAQHPALPTQIEGTWSVNGNTLTVSAMGQSMSATINGNQIIAQGKQITRIR